MTRHAIIQAWRHFCARRRGVEVASGARLPRFVHFKNGRQRIAPGSIHVAVDVVLDEGVVLDTWGGSIRIGARTFLGPHAVVYGHGGVQIGEDCLISMHARILSSEHAIPGREDRIRWKPDALKPTAIADDVWIGAGATILGGCRLGQGAVVGAGAVVTGNLPEYAVAAGVPARVIRYRDEKRP